MDEICEEKRGRFDRMDALIWIVTYAYLLLIFRLLQLMSIIPTDRYFVY